MNKIWNRLCSFLALVSVIGVSVSAFAALEPVVPERPSPLEVRFDPDNPGLPPSFEMPYYPRYAVEAQLEIWQLKVKKRGETWVLFARVWINDATMRSTWEYDAVNEVWRLYCTLLGTGPGGYRLFPAGEYLVQWAGYNPMGLGEYSWETMFEIAYPDEMQVEITEAPEAVEQDVFVSWRNNVAATLHQVEIRQGKKRLRNVKQSSNFDWGEWDSGDESLTGSYVDQPSSPTKDLPDGSGYVVQVRSYSPALKRWSTWGTTEAFALQRDAPVLPTLRFDPTAMDGFSDRSPWPNFIAEYDDESTTARWTQFEIAKMNSKGKRKVIRRQWNRSLVEDGEGDWSVDSTTLVGGDKDWPKGLAAGVYEWRVQAWNGRGADQSAWTDWEEAEVLSAGPLDYVNGNAVGLFVSVEDRTQEIIWDAVPNAFAYQVQTLRDGKQFRMSKWLKRGSDLWWDDQSTETIWSTLSRMKPLPEGTYQFAVRVQNPLNDKADQISDWSVPSREYTINLQAPVPTDLEAIVGYYVRLEADYGDAGWLEKEYEIQSLDSPKFLIRKTTYWFEELSLPEGGYTWRVRQRSAWNGWGGWSEWNEFEVF